jgi:hypothetical protein
MDSRSQHMSVDLSMELPLMLGYAFGLIDGLQCGAELASADLRNRTHLQRMWENPIELVSLSFGGLTLRNRSGLVVAREQSQRRAVGLQEPRPD